MRVSVPRRGRHVIQVSRRSPAWPAAAVLVSACLLLTLAGCAPTRTAPAPAALGGALDLRSWQPARDGPRELAGEWQFAGGRLLDAAGSAAVTDWQLRRVPDHWTGREAGAYWGQGSGTYRLRIALPPDTPPLGLRVKTISTACLIEANGRLVYQSGQPGADPQHATAHFQPDTVALPHSGDSLELLVRISNWDYRSGGMWRTLEIGPLDRLAAATRQAQLLTVLLGAALLATGINSLLIFLFRRSERGFLWFAVFVLAMSLRTMVTGEYLGADFLPFDLMIRLEYATTFANLPACALFFISLYPDIAKRLDRLVLIAPSLLFLVLTCLLPLPWLTRIMLPYYFVAFPGVAWLAFRILLPAARRLLMGSHLLGLGSLILAGCAINDALYASFQVMTANLMAVGLVVFVSLQATVMARRFTGAFSTSEKLRHDLAVSNQRLAVELEERRLNLARMEGLLAEKNLLIKEIHHRVKNSLQIVSSIISLHSNRQPDPGVRELLASLRLRIRAISLVHEKLYGRVTVTQLDLGSYVGDLVRLFVSGFGSVKRNISLELPAEALEVPVEFCIDLGLILTELLSNSLKYSQGFNEEVEIRIHMEFNDGRLLTRVSDNGPGFPDSAVPRGNATLGFPMMLNLLKRSAGTLRILAGPGATVELTMRPGATDADISVLEGPG